MMPYADHADRIALAARDGIRAAAVLAILAQSTACNAELRRATGWPGDSFRSLLRRMERAGLIVVILSASPARQPHRPRRWARADRREEHDGSNRGLLSIAA